jgi:hypothetical protein
MTLDFIFPAAVTVAGRIALIVLYPSAGDYFRGREANP